MTSSLAQSAVKARGSIIWQAGPRGVIQSSPFRDISIHQFRVRSLVMPQDLMAFLPTSGSASGGIIKHCSIFVGGIGDPAENILCLLESLRRDYHHIDWEAKVA